MALYVAEGAAAGDTWSAAAVRLAKFAGIGGCGEFYEPKARDNLRVEKVLGV